MQKQRDLAIVLSAKNQIILQNSKKIAKKRKRTFCIKWVIQQHEEQRKSLT